MTSPAPNIANEMRRDALLSPCGRYRHAISRDWTEPGQRARTILWVGLNPSTADAERDDPTLRRELAFSRGWGFTRLVKGNLLDWRATQPKDLPGALDIARSAENLSALGEMASVADCIVLASGRIPARFSSVFAETLSVLGAPEKSLFCLGQNADGSPKHPLYMRKDTPLSPFDI